MRISLQGRRGVAALHPNRSVPFCQFLYIIFLLGLAWPVSATAQGEGDRSALEHPEAEEPARWNLHLQNTDVVQGHPGFPADYSGPNSLRRHPEIKETVSFDLTVGARLWRGAAFYVDGLVWQGFGLSNSLGAAGFPNGEAFRLGTHPPDATVSRAFLRQTIGLGGERERAEEEPFQLPGARDVSRVTITVGKFSAKDLFDNNAYANDSREQFLNWSLMANGAWDYPADTLGFIPGLAVEFNQPRWAVRAGLFQVTRVANGLAMDPALGRAWATAEEVERRYTIVGRPGAIRLLGYINRAHMRKYNDMLADPILRDDKNAPHPYTEKFGFGLNAEQELADDLGGFVRIGWNDGRSETWMFTDIDRTLTVGLSLKGARWRRADDTIGLAAVVNAISPPHRHFLAVGGTGITVGDGALSYSREEILESYYNVQLLSELQAALDYQYVAQPAYNRARGPVSIFGARVHWEF